MTYCDDSNFCNLQPKNVFASFTGGQINGPIYHLVDPLQRWGAKLDASNKQILTNHLYN